MQGLARHQGSLKKLVIDVSNVAYCDWDTFSAEDAIPIAETLKTPPPGLLVNETVHFYDGLGSLGDFLLLRHLEISVCVLGPFSTVEDLIGMLPEYLESIVLLSPTQYGQPSIKELIKGVLDLGSSKMSNLQFVNRYVVER